MDEVTINVIESGDEVQVIVEETNEEVTIIEESGTVESVKHLFASPNDFIGKAPIGSLETQSVWRVTRITITEAGEVSDTKKWVNVKWTDILTLT